MSQRHALLTGLIVFAALMIVTPPQLAAFEGEPSADEYAALIERGRQSYVQHCGACHGAEGKGDGAVAAYLVVQLPDLGQISQRYGGEFPFDLIFDIVEGREVEGHGTRAMPVWGPAFMGLDPEAEKSSIKEKVAEVVYYLKSIQPALPVVSPKLGGEPN